MPSSAVFVTHDQDEALVLSDRIAVMNRGRIEQIDRPQSVFERANSAFVADFMGATNLFSGRIETRRGDLIEIALDGNTHASACHFTTCSRAGCACCDMAGGNRAERAAAGRP
jgi:putative spermidine/putrescine transport system ATP-binding protein